MSKLGNLPYAKAVSKLNKQGPKPLYLVYGQERFLLRAFVQRLRQLVADDAGGQFNLQTFTADQHDVIEVLAAAQQLPMFGSRRVVIVHADAWLSGGRGALNDDQISALAAYVEQPVASTTLAFVAVNCDTRLKAVKILQDAAQVVRCEQLSESETAEWLVRTAARSGRRLTREAAQLLVTLVGTDLNRLETELNKIIAYIADAGDANLGDDAVRAVVSATASVRIFDLLDAIAEKRGADAVLHLHELLGAGEPPLRILAMLTRQLRTLMQVRLLAERGRRAENIQKELGIHPFVARKSYRQARPLDAETLKQGLLKCIEVEAAVKSGRRPIEQALETLVVNLVARNVPDLYGRDPFRSGG